MSLCGLIMAIIWARQTPGSYASVYLAGNGIVIMVMVVVMMVVVVVVVVLILVMIVDGCVYL